MVDERRRQAITDAANEFQEAQERWINDPTDANHRILCPLRLRLLSVLGGNLATVAKMLSSD